ncbi:MAG: hypothetical protein H0X13_06075 [Ramlibacter sp.]|nr:hypothetical protein [Ramlibacter sp.]
MTAIPNQDAGSAAQSLLGALDAYSAWLSRFMAAEVGTGTEVQSGTQLIATVSEIRRTHFPYDSQLMSELLIVHTHLTTLLFEYQLTKVRGTPTQPLLKSTRCIGLVQRQIAAIEALRASATNRMGQIPLKSTASLTTGVPASGPEQ